MENSIDEKLPKVLDEIEKASHTEVVFKGAVALVGLLAMVAYCIAYVR